MIKQVRNDFFTLAMSPASYSLSRWYDVEIAGWQGRIRVYVDGHLALDYTDNDPLQYGIIAFETLENSQAQVDDIEIMASGPE